MITPNPELKCPACGKVAVMKTGAQIYPGRRIGGVFWACPDHPRCDYYVGCHRDSSAPLGEMAGAELRAARRQVHKLFDSLWYRKWKRDDISKSEARTAAYFWLAGRMGLTMQQCHIAKFDIAQCQAAIKICEAYARPKPAQPEQGSLQL